MSLPTNEYKFAKQEIRKILVAVLALMLVSVAYYFYIRNEALHSAEKRAEITLKSTERMILVRMGRLKPP